MRPVTEIIGLELHSQRSKRSGQSRENALPLICTLAAPGSDG
jgi:hypothetical protein